MVPASVLILATLESPRTEVEEAIQELQKFRVSFRLRRVCPEKAPEHLNEVLAEATEAKVVVCFSPESGFLASYVSAKVDLPVLARQTKANTGDLMKLVLRILANENPLLREELRRYRLSQSALVRAADRDEGLNTSFLS